MKFTNTLALLALIPSALSLPSPAVEQQGNGLAKREEKKKDTKYFHEAGGDEHLSHYDRRYFQGKVSYAEHRTVLRELIRSYVTNFEKMGAETWIAHGTLLGWWWNGKIMPWDYDLDVQVSTATLRYLGEKWNQTTHEHTFVNSDGVTVNTTYLLDVNPHHIDIDRGDGQNIIDARWIDMSNGAFVDITGLAERDPANHPGVWSCKNYHRYKTTDLYPMRVTEYEGVKATIPYAFERILIGEYGTKSLVTTEWQGHRWQPDLKDWVKTPERIAQEEEKARKEAEEAAKKAAEEKNKSS
ncbi:related to mannosylphosphorylation protein MNN4 [Cephalotrichum gorgonifer]|uniref:Related to mannosylphosphorylation protein MNN4 n=1 Tax=Cephalotrichum gorgonifer TaxID=2041049 RepID=A0AAE8MZB4_9PEZI|nr:related to mannosylphosphorylation protein MNN4 [Cephalotrichum gorgonifer]